MGLQARAIAALVALLVLLALCGTIGVKAYSSGKRAGEAKVRADWEQAVRDARDEVAAIRADGNTRAAELEQSLKTLEARYARTDSTLRKALRRPLACPASGSVGDVVLPADLVDSMFNREPAGAGAPGAAASQPAH